VLGTTDLAPELSACAMPVSLQVERLKRDLAARGDQAVTVLEVELHSLTGADRDAALDAIVADIPSPYVLIDGRLVCSGSIDIDAVMGALDSEAARSQRR